MQQQDEAARDHPGWLAGCIKRTFLQPGMMLCMHGNRMLASQKNSETARGAILNIGHMSACPFSLMLMFHCVYVDDLGKQEEVSIAMCQ